MGSLQPPNVDYLIVGAGVFGASTAYHLSKANPSASITLVDRTPFPCPKGASYDINKIVRADYRDIFYTKLALIAQRSWTEDPIWMPFYHQCGMIKLDNTKAGADILRNYQTLGAKSEGRMITIEESRELYDGLFADADYEDVEEIYYNPLVGWAEADSALKRAIEIAVHNGVEYVADSVSSLRFDEDGSCIGVDLQHGLSLQATKVLLCTGAGTAQLLADSAPHRPELQAKHRMNATGLCCAKVQLSPEQHIKYRNSPVFVHGVGHKNLGAAMPPTADGKVKLYRDVSFTNFQQQHKLDHPISLMPLDDHQSQWTIPAHLPKQLRKEFVGCFGAIYGAEAEKMEIDLLRICWDAETPDQDWIISPHPHSRNLYVATAGSFHGWKFLPILGEYVQRMLVGELDLEQAQRWAWDRKQKGTVNGKGLAERELKYLLI